RAEPLDLYAPAERYGDHCVIGAGRAAQKRMKTGNFTATLFRANFANADAKVSADTQTISKASAQLDKGQARSNLLGFFAMTEHFPNPDSRITLDPDHKDALGMPRIRLDWVHGRKDYADLDKTIDGLANALGASGEGRLCWSLRPDELLASSNASRHHMGTTRMHDDPKKGVVDANGR
ncbi:MAG: GMC oxidoreductase, partial [Allorhizobium sp.]